MAYEAVCMQIIAVLLVRLELTLAITQLQPLWS
jgi:hypothetical protein